MNLDPEGTKSDVELWNALAVAQLKTVVIETTVGLGELELMFATIGNVLLCSLLSAT